MCVCVCVQKEGVFSMSDFWASLSQIKVAISPEPAIILSYIVTKLGLLSKLEKKNKMASKK